MSESHPSSLQKTDSRELVIDWTDGHRQSIPFRRLRDACQCATCSEKRKALELQKDKSVLPVLSAADAMPLDIVSMQPVGNYGYNIQFSDGHATGIFTFDLLRSLD